MDEVLDRLFGSGRTGWLKTALLSGLLGIFGAYVFFGESVFDETHSKYYWILMGYPALAILRSIYWNARTNRIRQMLGDRKVSKEEISAHLDSVLEWNLKAFEQLGPDIAARFKRRRSPTRKSSGSARGEQSGERG